VGCTKLGINKGTRIDEHLYTKRQLSYRSRL
jgi:hypothetical protein